MAIPAGLEGRAVPAAAPAPLAGRTRGLLEGAILPTLLRLAAPNLVVMVVQAALTTFDAFVLGWLGPHALAGVSLAFPLIMLMQTMSAGGMGGGVASAVARALGSGRREDADAVVVHALAIATFMGLLFSGLLVGFGPALYRSMGGTGLALETAVVYSNVVFAGALAPWLLNILAAVIRGTGQMVLPATVLASTAVMHLGLSPALVFGWGPFPRLGVAGAATSVVTMYVIGVVVLLGYVATGRSLVRPSLHGRGFRWRLFAEILRVGAPAALNTILTNLTVVLVTGFVGPFGTSALAGYGMGARLEYLQIPLAFGLGSALVTMVGTSIGAGDRVRALRVAWIGAGLAAAVSSTIGLLAAVFPLAWLGLFTADPAVLAAGTTYLRIVGPTYGFFGLGLALYFASQGAGRMAWPLVAGALRVTLAGGGGWLVGHVLGGGLVGLFGAMATAMVVFGLTVATAIKAGAWERRPRVDAPRAS